MTINGATSENKKTWWFQIYESSRKHFEQGVKWKFTVVEQTLSILINETLSIFYEN